MLWWLQTQASELGCGATAASNPRQANLGAVLWWLHAPSKRTWVRCYGGFKPKASELACGTMVASNPKHAKLGAALWWQKTKASEIGCGVMANDIWVWCYGGKIPKQAKLSAVLWWPRKIPQQAKLGAVRWWKKSQSKRNWVRCYGGKSQSKRNWVRCYGGQENPKANENECGAMVAKKIPQQAKLGAVRWWQKKTKASEFGRRAMVEKSQSKRNWVRYGGQENPTASEVGGSAMVAKKTKQAKLGAVLWQTTFGCGAMVAKKPTASESGFGAMGAGRDVHVGSSGAS